MPITQYRVMLNQALNFLNVDLGNNFEFLEPDKKKEKNIEEYKLYKQQFAELNGV